MPPDSQTSRTESDGRCGSCSQHERIAKLEQTVRSQRGVMKAQGVEIVSLRRRIKGAQTIIAQGERVNGRLARDLIDAWEFLWRVAGGATTGGNARQEARRRLLNRKSTEADRAA